MRDTFVRTLLDLARRDSRVVLMTGDLGFGVLTEFEKELPRQFINVGVAEQNLVGLATGLAMSGNVAFVYSIGNFPTLRCLEQIRNDACYHQAPVKIVAVGAGFSYGALGISHHATEDIAIMRSLPDITVLSPSDLVEVEAATHDLYSTPGTCYLRLDKSHVPALEGVDPRVVSGKIRRLRDGKQVVILGTGGILAEALRAAELLEPLGINCAVFSVNTIKPLDADGIVAAIQGASAVVSVEEHSLDGGLGSCLAEVFADTGAYPAAFRRYGLRGGFSSVVGSQSYLRRHYGLDSDSLAANIRQLISESHKQ